VCSAKARCSGAAVLPLSTGIAAGFSLDSLVQAFRTMEAGARGKALILPGT
jgi:hypothetical protein